MTAQVLDAITLVDFFHSAVTDNPVFGIDFHAVGKALKGMDYSGWIVVEAEQDPAKAPPKEYSQMGFDHIQDVLKASGLEA